MDEATPSNLQTDAPENKRTPARRPRPQESDPWYGYDHWRLGRVQVTKGVRRLLDRYPFGLPVTVCLLGVVLTLLGVWLSRVLLPETALDWLPPLLMGFGGACVLLGAAGIVSSLVVRLFGGRSDAE